MSGPITWEQIVGLLSIAAVVASVWWFLQRQITEGTKELDRYKLHVAESYVTKVGLKEIKDELLGAVTGIRDDVRHLATRIDNMHELQSTKRLVRKVGE